MEVIQPTYTTISLKILANIYWVNCTNTPWDFMSLHLDTLRPLFFLRSIWYTNLGNLPNRPLLSNAQSISTKEWLCGLCVSLKIVETNQFKNMVLPATHFKTLSLSLSLSLKPNPAPPSSLQSQWSKITNHYKKSQIYVIKSINKKTSRQKESTHFYVICLP